MKTVINKKCSTVDCSTNNCRMCKIKPSNEKEVQILSWSEAVQHQTIKAVLAKLPSNLTLTDGTVVFVPAGQQTKDPIQLAACNSSNETLVVVTEANSNLTLLDTARCGWGDKKQETKLFILVGQTETVRLAELRCLSEGQRFNGKIWASVAKNGQLKLFSGLLGGGRLDCQTEILLEGQNAVVERYGLVLGTENGRHKISDTIRHFAVGTSSYIMTRGVLTDTAFADWKLLTNIGSRINNCNGRQDSQILLLSPTAQAEITPSLEIGTDDVICSHSASIGQPDIQSLFYLRSRGLSMKQARQLIALGFFRPLANQVWDDETQETVLSMIESRLECRTD